MARILFNNDVMNELRSRKIRQDDEHLIDTHSVVPTNMKSLTFAVL
jgi:hypothetical protein